MVVFLFQMYVLCAFLYLAFYNLLSNRCHRIKGKTAPWGGRFFGSFELYLFYNRSSVSFLCYLLLLLVLLNAFLCFYFQKSEFVALFPPIYISTMFNFVFLSFLGYRVLHNEFEFPTYNNRKTLSRALSINSKYFIGCENAF